MAMALRRRLPHHRSTSAAITTSPLTAPTMSSALPECGDKGNSKSAIQDQRYARPDGDRHRRHALSLQMGRPYLQRIAVITRIDETGALPPRIFFHNYFPHCCGRNRLNDAPRGSASVKFLTRSVRNQLAPIPLLRAQSCFCLPGVKRHGNTGFMRLAYRNFEVTGHRASAGLKTGE